MAIAKHKASEDKASARRQITIPGDQKTNGNSQIPHGQTILQARSDLASLTSQQVLQLQGTIGNQAVIRQMQQEQQGPVVEKSQNNTGLPDRLKSGIENLSGYSMDDVRVHYNSSKPAVLNALAYAQGNQIHLGAGQEKHLPHEAWHVVQQKQGRVRVTRQMRGGVGVNDDGGLEREADLMGEIALQRMEMESSREHPLTPNANDSQFTPTPLISPVHQSRLDGLRGRFPIQRMFVLGTEFQVRNKRNSYVGISQLPSYELEELRDAINEVGEEAEFIWKESLLKHNDGRIWYFRNQFDGEDSTHLITIQNEVNKRWGELHKKSRAFDGKSRAADNSLKGTLREDTGADYQNPKQEVGTPSKLGTKKHLIRAQSSTVNDSELTIKAKPGFVESKIIHYGKWDKGSRSPGQSTTMGTVNAKNYIVYTTKEDIKGRYEWLHLIGSSLGGMNVIGNLVAGTFDANTEEIPMENRMALWKKKDFGGGSITFTAQSQLEGDSWIAMKKLTLSGKDSKGNEISQDYDPMRQLVLTKEKYDAIKQEINELADERGNGEVQASANLLNMAAVFIGVVLVLGAIYTLSELYKMLCIDEKK